MFDYGVKILSSYDSYIVEYIWNVRIIVYLKCNKR